MEKCLKEFISNISKQEPKVALDKLKEIMQKKMQEKVNKIKSNIEV